MMKKKPELNEAQQNLLSELLEELEACSQRAFKCRECKNTHDIYYQPGATMLECDCPMMIVVLPDWNPRGVLRIWNQLHAAQKPEAKKIQELTKKYIETRINGEQSRLDNAAPQIFGSSTMGGKPEVLKSGGMD